MGNFRWTPDALAAFQKRATGWKKTEAGVTTHRIENPASAHRPSKKSELEGQLELQLKAAKIQVVSQHRPVQERKWTLDFAIPERKFGIEVQGGVHRIRDKFTRDIEKRAELRLAGWTVVEVDGESIRDGRALGWIERFLKSPCKLPELYCQDPECKTHK